MTSAGPKAGIVFILLAALATAASGVKYDTIDEAIARGDLEDVKAHLSATPETANQGSHPRMVPLQQAIMRKRPAIAAALIEAGADINIKDGSKRTPLHLAVERKDMATLKVLLRKKAKPNERDRMGWTPLHHAAAKDLVEIARALLDGGADGMTLSDLGGTPLHEAAASGGAKMVQLLLDRGVDPSIVSKTGKTARAIAEETKNQDALSALSP